MKNPQYSLRSFAKKLGVSSGTVSDILNGKRSVTKKMLSKLQQKLELAPTEIEKLYHPVEKPVHFEELSIEKFNLLSDGIHFSILSLINTEDFHYDLDWMARRLKTSKRELRAAIDRLIKLEMIIIENDTLKTTDVSFHSPDELSSVAIRKNHRQSLHEAEEALEQIDLELRDFTSLTLCADRDSIKEYKDLIRNFREDLIRLNETKTHNEVYKLAIQFFPISVIEIDNQEFDQ